MAVTTAQLNLTARDVRYLCFQGGGGKGAVYLGALDALEYKKLLPIVPAGQIKGICGASAGAITALLVACGFTASGKGGIRERLIKTSLVEFLTPLLLGDSA